MGGGWEMGKDGAWTRTNVADGRQGRADGRTSGQKKAGGQAGGRAGDRDHRRLPLSAAWPDGMDDTAPPPESRKAPPPSWSSSARK